VSDDEWQGEDIGAAVGQRFERSPVGQIYRWQPGEVGLPVHCHRRLDFGYPDAEDTTGSLGATMPFAVNNGVRIHYEVEGNGPPLVLHHGFAGCIDDWRDFGYAAPLARHNRLIIIDARGCGASDKPHDPAAYDPAIRSGDVAAVLDDVGFVKAHYFGNSYGGALAWALAKYIPERISSLIIHAAHPNANSGQGFRDALAQGLEVFLAVGDRMYGPYMNPERRARLATNDVAALMAAARDREDYSDILPNMRMPCLLVAGALDNPICANLQKAAPSMPNAELVVLRDCDHVATFGRTDLVLPVVSSFLARVAA
jgi:pimeloyl-ACP methyl ester carboxylesterase